MITRLKRPPCVLGPHGRVDDQNLVRAGLGLFFTANMFPGVAAVVLSAVSLVFASSTAPAAYVPTHLGNLSPYKKAPVPHGITEELPAGCVVDQVMLASCSVVVSGKRLIKVMRRCTVTARVTLSRPSSHMSQILSQNYPTLPRPSPHQKHSIPCPKNCSFSREVILARLDMMISRLLDGASYLILVLRQ